MFVFVVYVIFVFRSQYKSCWFLASVWIAVGGGDGCVIKSYWVINNVIVMFIIGGSSLLRCRG